MIFENDEIKLSRAQEAKQKWVELGAEYFLVKDKGTSQVQFAKDNKVSLSSFQKALSRYKNDIQVEYQKIKHNQKSRKRTTSKKAELINSFRQQLAAMGKDSKVAINNRSVKWFREKIAETVKGRTVKKPVAGRIYTYVYDAKYKDTLPYWDRFPLIIYLGSWQAKNGNTVFNGLNLHYIPPKARQEFLEELLPTVTTKKLSARSTLKVSWNSVKMMRGSDLMIKAYLPKHVKGNLVEIDPREWAKVVYMPLQNFQSQGKRYSARKVWSNY